MNTTLSIRSASFVTVLSVLGGVACAAEKAPGAALGSSWADATRMPDLFSGMWMTFSNMIEGDDKLNVPYTPAAQKYVAAYKAKRDIPYAQEGCTSPGLPISMRTGPTKFTYAPGLISIYMQATGHTRFIRMNQKMGKTTPKYYGNSVGHWEGDTLVIETQDFLNEITFQYGVGKGLPRVDTFGPGIPGAGAAPGGGPPPGPPAPPGGGLPPGAGPPPGGLPDLSKGIWGPHGEGMHMVERMHLVDPQTLQVSLTVYDDTVWTQPFVAETRNFKRIQKGISEIGPFSGEPEEWICTVSITSFDPDSNSYVDKDPEEMVKYLDKLGK